MDFKPYRIYSDTFIETGTHHGVSVTAALEAGFRTIKSVELSQSSYEYSKTKFSGNKKVTLYQGKSVDRLPEMIKDISIPSVFWLDAHPSGPTTAGHTELIGGNNEYNQDNILKKELDIILRHGCHVILIDDQQGWATAQQFADQVESFYPDRYEFRIEDEIRPNIHYKEKVLICQPV